MSRFQLPENRVVTATREQAGFTESVQSRTIRDFTPRFLGDDGKSSLVPPRVDNILDATFDRVARGSQEQTGGLQVATQSIAEWASDIGRSLDSIRFPSAVVDGTVFTPGGPLPLAQAGVGDLYDSADDFTKAILADSGFTRERVIDITGNDPQELNSWYNDFTYRLRTDQGLKAYAERHEIAYGAAGVGAFTLNIVDPLTVATIGTGTALSAGARTVAKTAVKEAGEKAAVRSAARVGEALKRGSFAEAITSMTSPVRNTEAMKILLPLTAAEGAGISLAAQVAQRDADIRYGLIEEEDPFQVDYLALGIGGALGMALGSLAYRAGGVEPPKLTPREYILHNEDSWTAAKIRERVDNGELDYDEMLDPDELLDLEGAERRATDLFHTEIYRDADREFVQQVYDAAGKPGGVLNRDLAGFMANTPSPSEFRAWVANPKRTGNDPTAISRARDSLLEKQKEYRDTLASGDRKAAEKIKRKVDNLRADYDEAIKEFTYRGQIDDDELLEDLSVTPIVNIGAPEANRRRRTAVVLDRLGTKYTGLNTVSGKVHGFLAKAGDAMSPSRKLRAAGRNPENPLDTKIAALADLVINDSTGVAIRSSKEGRTGGALSFHEAHRLVATQSRRVESRFEEALRTVYGGRPSEEQRRALGRAIYERVGLGVDDGIDPKVTEAADFLRTYLDDMGKRGVETGYLPDLRDNYLPFQIRADADKESLDKLADFMAQWLHRWLYDPKKADAALHGPALRNVSGNAYKDTLERLEIDPNTDPGDLRLDFSDLPREYRAEYLERLDFSLREASALSVAKRQGRDSNLFRDPLDRGDDTATTSFMDSRGERKWEQEFWLQPEVMDLGVIETDIREVLKFYDRSTGYNIARQMSLMDATGEVIRFDDAIAVLRNDPNITPAQKVLIDELEQMERVNARRVPVRGKNMVPRILNGFARGTVNMGVGPAIAATEVQGALAAQLFDPTDIRLNVRHLIGALSRMDKATMREMGFGYVDDHDFHRMFGDLRDRDLTADAGPIAGRIAKGVLWYEDKSRIVGLERATTNFALTVRFRKAFAAFYFRKDKIDKMATLRTDLDYNSKEFKASAREAGFGSRVDVARDMAEAGLLDPDMIRMAKRFNEVNPDALSDIRYATEALDKLPSDELELGREFVDRLRSYAARYAEQFVTTADASTTVRSDLDWTNLFLQFMSFPQAWFTKTLRRTAESPAHTQIGYLGLYAIGEAQASIIRDLAYGGYSPETVMERWDADPIGEMAKVLSRMPVVGPWSQIPQILMEPLQDDPSPSFAPGSASLSMAVRGMTAMRSASKDILNGEPIRPSVDRTAQRLIPGWNQWALRAALGIATDADPDR